MPLHFMQWIYVSQVAVDASCCGFLCHRLLWMHHAVDLCVTGASCCGFVCHRCFMLWIFVSQVLHAVDLCVTGAKRT